MLWGIDAVTAEASQLQRNNLPILLSTLMVRILNSLDGDNYSPGLLCMMPPSAKIVVAVI